MIAGCSEEESDTVNENMRLKFIRKRKENSQSSEVAYERSENSIL